MLKTKFKAVSILGLLLASPGFSFLAAAEPQFSAADRLTDLLGQSHSMTANVLQLTLDQQGREVQEFEATLSLEKPDHFYWHATEPYERLLVTDGVKVWNWEPDLEQVTIDPFNSDYGRTPALLLSADADTLEALFDISLLEGEGDVSQFVLYPLEPDSLFTRLSLTFEGNILSEMHIEDSLGQKTTMNFFDVVINPMQPAGLFSFEIPEGADVIDSTVPPDSLD